MRTILFIFLSAVPVQSDTVGSVNAMLMGQTLHWYDKLHGNQIEYLGKKGSLYLWYPNNRRIVRGQWKAQTGERCAPDPEGYWKCVPSLHPDLCFKFPKSSFNPATKKSGGTWECSPWRELQTTLVEKTPGDIFQLAERKRVPFKLRKKLMEFKEIARRIDR